jgi:DsbC/DsbD-like thiol-disulfide interchange protein
MKLLAAFVLIAVVALGFGQEVVPKATLTLDKATAVAGSVVSGKVTITFDSGLHGYQNPPTLDYQIPLKLEAQKGSLIYTARFPKGVPFLMEGEKEPSMVYENTIEIPVWVKASATPGQRPVKLTVTYQQCNASSCFPPGSLDISAPLTVTPAPKPKKGK